jgi:hypothetical protein
MLTDSFAVLLDSGRADSTAHATAVPIADTRSYLSSSIDSATLCVKRSRNDLEETREEEPRKRGRQESAVDLNRPP